MDEIATTTPTLSTSWMEKAICRGRTDIFFAPLAERPQARVRREALAKAICRACPVSGECRDYGRQNHEYGVWGGEAELERHNAGFVLVSPVGLRAALQKESEKSA